MCSSISRSACWPLVAVLTVYWSVLQRANDHGDRVRLVIDHQDVKATLRNGRLEGIRRDERLQRGVRLQR